MTRSSKNALRLFTVVVFTFSLCFDGEARDAKRQVGRWNLETLDQSQKRALQAFYGSELNGKTGPMQKLGYQLSHLYFADADSREALKSMPSARFGDLSLTRTGGNQFVLIDAKAAGDARVLAADLRAIGALDVSVAAPVVSARVPVRALDKIASLGSLHSLRPSLVVRRTGNSRSQGDFAVRGPAIRPPLLPNGPTGFGVSVGVISDSYNCLGGAAADSTNGEFPNGVLVLREQPGCTFGIDEGLYGDRKSVV